VAACRRRIDEWKPPASRSKPGTNGRLDQAYVTRRRVCASKFWRTRNQPMPIQSEHAHFFLPEPTSPRARPGTEKSSAPKAGVRNNAPVADVPGLQLRFNKAEQAQVPTKGRVLDQPRLRREGPQGLHQDQP